MIKKIRIIYFLIKGFLLHYSQKNFLLRKIIILFFSTALIITLINAISYGVFLLTKTAILQNYGDIHIQLHKKITKKNFLKKNIKKKLLENKNIKHIDVYGIIDGILIAENRHIPIIILSYLELSSLSFNSYKHIPKKNNFSCGKVLFHKYQKNQNKKILLITKDNQKKKILFFDSMPIEFNDPYTFIWDDWNEKSILIPVEKIESYFEIPTIEYLNLHLFNANAATEVIAWIKKNLYKEINYIDHGEKILPEYNKFIILLDIITYSIQIIIILFSYLLQTTLINLYFYENKIEFYFLLLTGIKKKYLFMSILFFFLIVLILSFFLGCSTGYVMTSLSNYLQCIPINKLDNNYFLCFPNWSILSYGLCYILLLIFQIIYFCKKYL
jgi:hypothetical protein